MRKSFIFIFLILSLFTTGFSAVENITQCPVTTTDSTEYVFQPGFSFSSNPCFDLTGTTDVIINGNNLDLMGTGAFQIDADGNVDNALIKNVIMDDFFIRITGTQNHIELAYNYIYQGHSWLYTGLQSGLPNTNTANAIMWITGSGSAGSTSNWLNVHNNRFEGDSIDQPQNDNNNLIHYTSNTYGWELDVSDNDFIGYGLFGRNLDNGGGSGGQSHLFHPTLLWVDNNVYLDEYPLDTYLSIDNSQICTNFNINPNNLMSGEALTDVLDNNGISDEVLTITSNGCTLLNTNVRTTKQLNEYPFAKGSETEFATMTPLFYGTQIFDNARYYLGKSLTLDTTNYFNFASTLGTTLDLSLFPSATALTIENLNTLRMGTETTIIGDESSKSNIASSGTLYSNPSIIAYALGFTGSMITAKSQPTIENIVFNLGGTGDQNFAVLSNTPLYVINDAVIKNNEFNYNMASPFTWTPGLLTLDKSLFTLRIGFDSLVIGNVFDIKEKTNQVFSFYGSEDYPSITIQDNTFIRTGVLFEDNTYSNQTINLIHNDFFQQSGVYSYPYDLSDSTSTNGYINLDGEYVYQPTECDSYIYNMGNRYEDLTDDLSCTDNGQGLCSENPMLRTNASASPLSYDDYAVYSYPFDFASNTGMATYFPLCEPFTWNVLTPLNNTDYDLVDNPLNMRWSFDSTTYSTMDCKEYIQGEPMFIRNGVNSGDEANYFLEFTNGRYEYEIVCKNKAMEKSIKLNFTFGGVQTLGPLPIEVTIGGEDILGCTDNTATNYNPLATIDDGTCTGGGTTYWGCMDVDATNYDALATQDDGTCISVIDETPQIDGSDIIDYDSISNTNENAVGFMGNIIGFVVSAGVPFAVLVIILISFLGVMRIFI